MRFLYIIFIILEKENYRSSNKNKIKLIKLERIMNNLENINKHIKNK